jgi:hypothetical protein
MEWTIGVYRMPDEGAFGNAKDEGFAQVPFVAYAMARGRRRPFDRQRPASL